VIIPIIVLAVVFTLIAVRRIGNFRLQIWQVMLFGAVAVLLTGQITPMNALRSINSDVILFLFGMFVVGEALEESGYLGYLSHKIFRRAKSADQLILYVLFGIGVASAFLMNDTLAIIGTPVVLLLAREHNMPAKVLLFTLAFAVTIGSTMSPIGNPQNLLVAIDGNVANPFVTFFGILLIPTVINLFLAYFMLRLFYKKHFHGSQLIASQEEKIKDHELASLSRVSLILIIILVLAKIIIVSLNIPIDFSLTYIALISAIPVLLLSPKRFDVIKRIDWSTLIFFAAMFILMESVWESGFFQLLIAELNLSITSTSTILVVGVLLSQLISNVPLVALYLPLLISSGATTKGMIALAAGSTIAGNLFILGAASNVIIIQNAEKKSGETLTFLEFAKIGIPMTTINILIYWLFLRII
jgi:Na+/H+ antiporter NhaD/arsenite permease-like protein